MATKKTAAKSKKTTRKPASAASRTTTKVTTVKAASKQPKPAARAPKVASARAARSEKFSFSRSPLLAASIAEFVGTFLLGAVVLTQQAAPLAVFFGVVAIVLGIGLVSGAHINPAITVGAWVTRRIGAARATAYIVAQVLGALLALVIVNAFVSSAADVSPEAAQLGQQSATLFSAVEIPEGKEWLLLSAEVIGAIIFGFIFAAVTRERSRVAHAFGIGGGLFLALLITSQFATIAGTAGTILNPAIAASLQALSWSVWPLLIYVVTPVVGVVIGFALQDLIKNESQEDVVAVV